MVLVLSACKKKTECCVFISMDVDLDLRYKNGLSVFDAGQPGHLTKDSISVYYLINGKYQLNKDAKDQSYPFNLIDQNKSVDVRLNVFVSDQVDQKGISYTLVKYGSLQTDTIKAVLKKLVIQQAWLNGQLVTRNGKPFKTVVK